MRTAFRLASKSFITLIVALCCVQTASGLAINDRVSVVNAPKNVRSTPDSSSSSNVLGEKSINGELGTIIDGPITATGFTWCAD